MICMWNTVGAPAKTNEEFRIILHKRIRIFTWLVPIGVLSAALGISNELLLFSGENPRFNGICTGIGMGLITVALIRIYRYRKILKEEALIKEERLKSQDERNLLIAGKAQRAAMFIVLAASYAMLLVAGFFDLFTFFCFFLIILLFLVSYLGFTAYYNRKL